MKVVFYTIVISVFVSCMGRSGSQSQSHQTDTTLAETINAFNTAFAEGNVDTLETMIVDSYLHTNGDAAPIRKEDWIKYLRLRQDQMQRGDLVVDKYEMSEMVTDFYDDAAIVTGRINVSYTQSAQTRNDAYRVTQLWVREGKRWKRAAFHDTRIQ